MGFIQGDSKNLNLTALLPSADHLTLFVFDSPTLRPCERKDVVATLGDVTFCRLVRTVQNCSVWKQFSETAKSCPKLTCNRCIVVTAWGLCVKRKPRNNRPKRHSPKSSGKWRSREWLRLQKSRVPGFFRKPNQLTFQLSISSGMAAILCFSAECLAASKF